MTAGAIETTTELRRGGAAMRVAVIGLGPWGMCALERLVTTARRGLSGTLEVHAIDPARLGGGVYGTEEPDYLLLNNACGQLSLYPFADEGTAPPYALGLYEWATGTGYRWVGDRCQVGSEGAAIEPHHFLPRRLMGEYLRWFYRALVSGAPDTVRIVRHQAAAIDCVATSGGEEVWLSDGSALDVDHVILTTGHTPNQEAELGTSFATELPPYPVTPYVDGIPTDSTVAVSGMGLVAVDVVTTLTTGRGGRFVPDGSELRYVPSGREPALRMFSRSGLPFTAKSVTGGDLAGVYEPVICTPAAIDAISGRGNGSRRQADVRGELLPLLFGEMYARYYAQVAFQRGTRQDAATVRDQLRLAWDEHRFDAALARLGERYGSFDAPAMFFGHQAAYPTRQDYERYEYDALVDDLREAEVPDGASPVKSAAEVFRIFRDPTRAVVEQGGLELDSYLDFNGDVRSRIHRLVAGPPALRSRQLLALMDAGVLQAPYGPAPMLSYANGDGRRTRIASTAFEHGHEEEVDVVIRGRLETPLIQGSASELYSRLCDRGRVGQFRYGSVHVGSVNLTPESHPIDRTGEPQENLWMFGPPTEGIRHFQLYIPSPGSRIRAFEELGACVSAILA